MKKNRSSFLRAMGFLFFTPLLVLVSFFVRPSAEATSLTQTLSGYAWGGSYVSGSSGNIGGFGWISFNCSPDQACVTIDSSGYLHGYAWNPYFGWIQFGGLNSFPAGPGSTADNAKLSGNNLTGWARLAMNAGVGWNTFDGYIALSGQIADGTARTYGITNTGGQFSGYAWGGPDMGWINFAPLSTTGCQGVCVITTAPPSVDLKIRTAIGGTPIDGPVTITAGSTVWLSWTSASVPSGSLCTTSSYPKNDKQWTSSSRASASSTFPYVVKDGVVLSIACADGKGGITAPDSVTIDISQSQYPPTANLLISTSTPPSYSAAILAADSGTQPRLSWSSNNYTTSCVGIGSGFSTGGATSSSIQLGAVTSSQNYQLKCYSADGSSVTSSAVGLAINNPSGTCTDPATGNPIAVGAASSTYYLAPQARVCQSEPRQCVSNNGVIGLSNDPRFVYSACSVDPTIIEQ